MWSWGGCRPASRTDPLHTQNSSAQSPTFSQVCGQQSAPLGPNCSASLGPRPASSCGLASVPAQKGHNISPQISASPPVPPPRAGVEVGRAVVGFRGEFMVAARPARLGRGVWRALPVLPASQWTSPRSSRLPSAGRGGIPHVK